LDFKPMSVGTGNMPRRHWEDLPRIVRLAIEDRVGRVHRADSVAAGSVSELVVTLHTDDGPIFCKGIRTANPQTWMHRNEARLNPHLPDAAPRLQWVHEEAGWA
jgi:hypothetical protein